MIGRRPGVLGSILAVSVMLIVGGMRFGPREHTARERNGLPAAAPEALLRSSPRTSPESTRPPTPPIGGPARFAVPFTEKSPLQPSEAAPAGWTLKEFAGQADVGLLRIDGRVAMRLRSEATSFAVYRDALVDPNDLPILSWSWKALRLPSGGDVRVAARDDQAAQLYVVFPRWPSPLTNSDVIGYIWDTTAPVDARLTSPRAANVKLIVVESGAENLGRWRRYERNVLDDYVALFGKRPPRVGKLALMIDSDDTQSGAEAAWSDVAFQRPR